MNGYVYILINSSMPGLIKVGHTIRDSRARARELHTTGVPTPFTLAFEVLSDDCTTFESRFHDTLDDFRVSTNREFFRYPLDRAISLLQELHTPPKSPTTKYVAEDILERIREQYADWLRPDIVGVSIVQSDDRVWLEITREETKGGNLVDQRIHRMDVANLWEGKDEHTMFPPAESVSSNAAKFVKNFYGFSIFLMDDLIHEDARKEIFLALGLPSQ